MSPLYQQLAFFNELEKLKMVTRRNQTLDGRFENSAEHSWQLALMAPVLRQHFPEEVDLEKVMTMLLLHEIGEIGAGDTWVYDEVGKLTSFDREWESVKKTLALLPPEQADSYRELWLEFESKEDTPEARYARCLDALAPLMNHLLIAPENENLDSLTKSQVLAKKAFIKEESAELWELVLDLVDQSVAKGLYLDK
ncbi:MULTISPECIES: HD domain-containing protein [Streptococcus]|uniref:HD domain-containing protein n=1 Tax=Streptococcus orisratti TaxID=114652 RepID=UPI0023F21E3A|nr:HD domain-containing protein [Streptococcus hyointestinalis]MCI6871324.1 HD domain-containing protein [Streptococcus hyointestinalis]